MSPRSVSPRPAPRQTQPAPVRAQPPAPVSAAPQQPSLFGQMAATAGGVAVGSAIVSTYFLSPLFLCYMSKLNHVFYLQGHTVGHAVTGMFSGSGSDHEVAAPAAQAAAGPAPVGAYQDQQASGPCAWEVKQFLQCAQQQDDLSLCSGFNEAIRQCKEMNREYSS